MPKVLAALGLAVAVPVALAAPALAKPPIRTDQHVLSVLRQHEGFRAEVSYLCTGPKHQEGVIKVVLQQAAPPVVTAADAVDVATGYEDAKCDGRERETKVKLPVTTVPVQADKPVRLVTTLVVIGNQVAYHACTPEPVVHSAHPTPGPTSTGTGSATSTPSASSTATGSATSTPATPSESGHPDDNPSGTPSPSTSGRPEDRGPSVTASPSEWETEGPETETHSPSPSGSGTPSPSATATS